MRTEPTTSDQPVTFPRKVRVSAWVAPIMVVGTFAFFAAIPVALVVYGVLRRVRTGALRWWAIALGVVYAIPMATWLLKPDRPPSLSKDISPVFVAMIVVASVGVIYTLRTHASRAEAPSVADSDRPSGGNCLCEGTGPRITATNEESIGVIIDGVHPDFSDAPATRLFQGEPSRERPAPSDDLAPP